jgi:hypothetical protein
LRAEFAEANGGRADLARLQQVVVLAHLDPVGQTRAEALRELAALGRWPGGFGTAARELAIVFETVSHLTSALA